MDYLTVVVESEMTKDEVFDIVSAVLPDRRWGRGDSGNQGAWYVTTHDGPGRSVDFWCFEEEPGIIYADLSARGVGCGDEAEMVRRRRFFNSMLEVLPLIGVLRPLSPEAVAFLAG